MSIQYLERQIFQLVRRWAKNKGIKATPEPSYLRVQQSLANSKTVYDFQIKNDTSTAQQEVKLDRNDLFITSHIGLFLIPEVSTTLGAEVLHSYPNQTAFAAASGFTPAHLNVVYNGFLRIKTGQTVNAQNIPGWNFYYAAETQKSAATNEDQFNIKEHSHWLNGLMFWFKGWSSIEIKHEIQSFTGLQIAAVAANTTNKLVLHLGGYLIKNAIDYYQDVK